MSRFFNSRFLLLSLAASSSQAWANWDRTSLSLSLYRDVLLSPEECSANYRAYEACRASFTSTLQCAQSDCPASLFDTAGYLTSDFELQTRSEFESKDFSKLNADRAALSSVADSKISKTRIAGAINLWLSIAMDPHTYILPDSASDAPAFQEDERLGIGVMLILRNQKIYVAEVVDNSPASKAGILEGDQILSLNGEEISKLAFPEIGKILTHPEISPKVEISWSSQDKVKSATLTRELIKEDRFRGELHQIEGRTYGYLRVPTLDDYDAGCFFPKDFLLKAERENEMAGWILDIRNNGGGGRDILHCIASLFIEKDKPIAVFAQVGSIPPEVFFASSKSSGERTRAPVIILQNWATASFAEMLSATLRDYRKAYIAGERSFGKATQQIIDRPFQLTPLFGKLPKAQLSIFAEELWMARSTMYMFSPLNYSHQRNGVPVDFELSQGLFTEDKDATALPARKREAEFFINALPNPTKPFVLEGERLEKVERMKTCTRNRRNKIDVKLEELLSKNLPVDRDKITALEILSACHIQP